MKPGHHQLTGLWLAGLLLSALLAACAPPSGGGGGSNEPFLKRASKSGAIAITGDDRYVVQVNPEDDSISIFRTSDDVRTAKLAVGDEPSAVVIGPDDKTAFVALRAEAKIIKVNRIDTGAPTIVNSVNVGSEPTGLALSPCGKKLVVAEFGEGRVSTYSTDTLASQGSVIVAAPRAVAVSNNGNSNCDDEKIVVTEFYGRIGPGREGSDNSRTGAVRIFRSNDLSEVGTVLFEPTDPGAFPVDTSAANSPVDSASPNQLASVAIVGDKFIATAIAAAPNNAPKFDENVFQYLLIGDLNGNKLGTISISEAIRTLAVPAGTTKFFMADLVDIGVVGNNILYLLAKGGEAIQRAILISDTAVTLGTPTVPQIDLQTLATKCQNPIGLVTPHDTTDQKKMFVNCWVTRNTGIVDLSQQKLVKVVESAPAPTPGSLDEKVSKGRHFYFTGRGRWSKGGEGWSSCGSCHPDGLSDNITWHFAAGPRQTTSMDGSFSHGPGTQKQRIFNWSGIFDEQHDFERNTRDVSGGLGALTTGGCGNLATETRINLTVDGTSGGAAIGGLAKPLRELQEATPSCVKDWDDIDEFVKTIRPPKGRRFLDAGSVARGRLLFREGKCANCHGGAGWTLSRRFFIPAAATNTALATAPFNGAPIGSPHTVQIANEPASTPIAPAQVACVLRKVGTFGVPGDTTATNALELKAGRPPTARAQGEFSGYNIPSLYGLQVGAPFLHHGQAKTLDELFSDGKWSTHLLAGNAVFTLNATQRQDLINFLLSIDTFTSEEAPAAGSEVCPSVFPAP